MNSADASQQLGQAASFTRTLVNRQADMAATLVGKRMHDVAGSLRRVATDLRSDAASTFAAQLADQGADAVDRAGDYLTAADGRRLVEDAGALTQRNPILAAGVAYLAGLSLSRFLKTSATDPID
jgi:hypothetical protein